MTVAVLIAALAFSGIELQQAKLLKTLTAAVRAARVLATGLLSR
jgi:hypothetical protein